MVRLMPSTAASYSSMVGIRPRTAERTTTGVEASSDSPFFVDDVDDEKEMMSAESRFAANSKLSFVRVEFSKNAKTIVFPRSVGTFFISRLLTSRNDVAVESRE